MTSSFSVHRAPSDLDPSIRSALIAEQVAPQDSPSSQLSLGQLSASKYREATAMLLSGDAKAAEFASLFLHGEIAALPGECELPAVPEDVMAWMMHQTEAAGKQWLDYLAERRLGGNRRMFATRSQAIFFLQHVAPTKLVDGSWLFGTLSMMQDMRAAPLINTYLDELGDGDPVMNHVTMFSALLQKFGIHAISPLDLAVPDDRFHQASLQLALAHAGSDFLPEVIGFNLGYEQLPLHLMITAYELNELGIDPYYFTLHITVDNADTGHALQAVQAMLNFLPAGQVERREFYRRVRNGFLLSNQGVGSVALAKRFDLQQEVVRVFRKKGKVGSMMHSDYCRIDGKTVNAWLADPALIPDFLQALESAGWITRHQNPRLSRFWKLIDGNRAEMFGVFSETEKQLLFDWIAGDASGTYVDCTQPDGRHLSFRQQQRRNGAIRNLTHFASVPNAKADDGVGAIENQRNLLAPKIHHLPEGLAATRSFSKAWRAQCGMH